MKKLLAPIVLAGTVLAGVTAGGAAYAAAPSATPTAAAHHAHRGQARAWIKAHRTEIRQQALTVAAGAIGVTPQVLEADLVGGQSMAQVAVANGKTAQDVIDALVAAVDARVALAVTAGQLTQHQADAIDARMAVHIPRLVERVY